MIWSLSDTHLSFLTNKPMDIFGPIWENHAEKIAKNWRAKIKNEDIIIIPGDISWGMNLKEAKLDLAYLHELPGKKFITKGNHDFWWASSKKVNDFCAEHGFYTLNFVRNQAVVLEETDNRQIILCGTRGWILPTDTQSKEADKKIYQRELLRLEMSLKEMEKLRKKDDYIICAFHYPPLHNKHLQTDMTQLLKAYNIDLCLYGHLHGWANKDCVEGLVDGIEYKNVSADHIKMDPQLIYPREIK